MRGLRLQMNALNLFDTKTYETVYSAHTVPGTGRTVVFSVAAKF
jgi:catecholate siderophore receptor